MKPFFGTCPRDPLACMILVLLTLLAYPAVAADPDRVLLRCSMDVIAPGALGSPDTTDCVKTQLGGPRPSFVTVTATVHGDPQPVAGRYPVSTTDKALEFDGTGDYLTIPNMPTLDGATSLTVEAWVWVDSPSVNVFRLQQPVTLGSDRVQVYDTDGGSGWTTLVSHGQDAPLETWYHVAGVFDQRELRIYVDGRLSDIAILDFEAVTSVGAGYSTWAIGARALTSGADQEFEGRIDEVSVYAEALPAGTIFRHARDRATLAATEINVRTHTTPALGDGLTNDAVALQSALTAAGLQGADVFFPPGTYRIGASLVVPSGVLIRGDQGTEIMPLDNVMVSPIFELDDIEGSTIRDLEIRGRSFKNSQTAALAGIEISGSERIHVDNVGFSDLGDSVDSYGGIQLVVQGIEGLAGDTGASLHNVIENSHFDDWDHLTSFGVRFTSRWHEHHITPPDSAAAVRENIVKNNFFTGFYQAVEIAGPETSDNLIRGNTAVDPIIVGVEADKGAKRNVFVENTIRQVRAPGDTSISGMRDQGFLQCDGTVFEYELYAEDNVFLRNVIFDVSDPRNAGGILLSRTDGGLFQDNMVRSITGGTQTGMALLRDGLVTNYTFQQNLREAGLAQQTVIPATSCN